MLYEFEACPFCRRVRDTLAALGLDALIFPCPKRGRRYRPWVRRQGREQFPYFVDPNTGTALYESRHIVEYLMDTYAAGRGAAAPGTGTLLRGMLAGWSRLGAGAFARPSRMPEHPLELWSDSASMASRRVRERLCVLETVHVQHPVASFERGAMLRLADPNTGGEYRGSAAILAHLDHHYGGPSC